MVDANWCVRVCINKCRLNYLPVLTTNRPEKDVAKRTPGASYIERLIFAARSDVGAVPVPFYFKCLLHRYTKYIYQYCIQRESYPKNKSVYCFWQKTSPSIGLFKKKRRKHRQVTLSAVPLHTLYRHEKTTTVKIRVTIVFGREYLQVTVSEKLSSLSVRPLFTLLLRREKKLRHNSIETLYVRTCIFFSFVYGNTVDARSQKKKKKGQSINSINKSKNVCSCLYTQTNASHTFHFRFR